MAKPHKVEEPAGTYSVSPKRKAQPSTDKTGAPALRRADPETFRKAAGKVFKTHHDLLRRLAQ